MNKSKKFMNKITRKGKRNTRKGKGIRSKRTMRKKNNQRTMRKKNKRRSETGGLPSPKSDAEKIAKLILEEEGFDDMPLDTSLGFIKDGKFVPMYSPELIAADSRMRADRLKGSKFGPDAEEAAIRAERKADEADRKKTTRHAKPSAKKTKKKTAPHHKRHTPPVRARSSVPPPPPLDSSKEFPPLGK